MNRKHKLLKVAAMTSMLLAGMMPIKAQDIVHGVEMPDNYFSSFWIDQEFASKHYFIYSPANTADGDGEGMVGYITQTRR